MVEQAKEPKTNDERQEDNTEQALSIVNEAPAENDAGDEEPDIVKPVITASPKTPLVVVKKDEDGKPEVTLNPTPEASTKEAPAVKAESSSPSVTPTVTPTVKPVADEAAEPSAPESKPAVTVSGKTVDAADAPVVAKNAQKDPEVAAAKTETATPDKDVEKIKLATEASTNSDEAKDQKVAVVKKVVKKVETVAQDALKDVETILKDTELAVEKAKPLIPNKCFYIQALGPDGKGTDLYFEVD